MKDVRASGLNIEERAIGSKGVLLGIPGLHKLPSLSPKMNWGVFPDMGFSGMALRRGSSRVTDCQKSRERRSSAVSASAAERGTCAVSLPIVFKGAGRLTSLTSGAAENASTRGSVFSLPAADAGAEGYGDRGKRKSESLRSSLGRGTAFFAARVCWNRTLARDCFAALAGLARGAPVGTGAGPSFTGAGSALALALLKTASIDSVVMNSPDVGEKTLSR